MKVTVACLGTPIPVPGMTPKALNGLTLVSRNLAHIITDFDDTLVPGGIGTEHSQMTMEDFLIDNASKVIQFKTTSQRLKDRDIQLAICTGRSGDFIIPWMEHLFNSGVCNVIIGEGGATIHRFIEGEWKLETPRCVNRDSLSLFMEHREQIIEIAKSLGAFYETGKLVIASFNPPIMGNGKVMPIEKFYALMEKELEKLDLLGKISFMHSTTAVDIGPLGADKVDAMLEVTNDEGHRTAYAGDAMNDRSVMFQCLVNLCPGNADENHKRESSQAACCLFSRGKVLDGVNDLLETVLNILDKKY